MVKLVVQVVVWLLKPDQSHTPPHPHFFHYANKLHYRMFCTYIDSFLGSATLHKIVATLHLAYKSTGSTCQACQRLSVSLGKR